jgi:CO/xanthine dehydrogenase Mo-binding subunit
MSSSGIAISLTKTCGRTVSSMRLASSADAMYTCAAVLQGQAKQPEAAALGHRAAYLPSCPYRTSQ